MYIFPKIHKNLDVMINICNFPKYCEIHILNSEQSGTGISLVLE